MSSLIMKMCLLISFWENSEIDFNFIPTGKIIVSWSPNIICKITNSSQMFPFKKKNIVPVFIVSKTY
jgi:hypothetical protein